MKHYIVRMIKPDLSVFSRLACSSWLSKILTAIRLSGPFWIEAAAVLRPLHVLELVAPCFCANFSRLSNLAAMCQGTPLTLRAPDHLVRVLPSGSSQREKEPRESANLKKTVPRTVCAGAAGRPWEMQGTIRPDSGLQWIVLSGFPSAPEARRLSNRPRFAHHNCRGKTTLCEALPLRSILSTLPRRIAILQIGRGTGDLFDLSGDGRRLQVEEKTGKPWKSQRQPVACSRQACSGRQLVAGGTVNGAG